MLYRKQFGIHLGFSITINKSQGQDFENLGLYICKPLFSHELYVALSRRKNSKNIFIQNDLEDPSASEYIIWNKILN